MNPIKKVYYHVSNYFKIKKKSMHSFFDIRTSFLGEVVCEGHNSIEKNCIIDSVRLGYGSYIGYGSYVYNTEIGRYCSIGRNLKVLRGQHPTEIFVSTYPAFYRKGGIWGLNYYEEDSFQENKYVVNSNYRAVIIENDVWIGDNVSVMEGVTIGNGAIIAAGAVVTKNVEPYCIVGGVPAKLIRKRFNDDDITYLLKLKWWDKDEQWIEENAEYFTDIKILRKVVKL